MHGSVEGFRQGALMMKRGSVGTEVSILVRVRVCLFFFFSDSRSNPYFLSYSFFFPDLDLLASVAIDTIVSMFRTSRSRSTGALH